VLGRKHRSQSITPEQEARFAKDGHGISACFSQIVMFASNRAGRCRESADTKAPHIQALTTHFSNAGRPSEKTDKEDRGHVPIIGGSGEVPGAALLAATAALRSGAGKLTMTVPRSVALGLALAMPEARLLPSGILRDGGSAKCRIAWATLVASPSFSR